MATVELDGGYEIYDVILPDIEPIDMLPVKTPGYLYLPEHGVRRELEELEYLSNEKEILDRTVKDLLHKLDDQFLDWSLDDVLDDLAEFGVPTAEESLDIITLDEATKRVDKLKELSDTVMKEKLATAKNDENDEHIKFDPDVWMPAVSISSNTSSIQNAWNRVSQAMASLRFSDELKETVTAIMVSITGMNSKCNLSSSVGNISAILL